VGGRVTPTGVRVVTLRAGFGTGDSPRVGERVRFHYTVRLPGGPVFDSSRARAPEVLRVGAGTILAGLEDGLCAMEAGETAEVTVPPARGFGARGYPPLAPPNTALVYEVEILAIEGH